MSSSENDKSFKQSHSEGMLDANSLLRLDLRFALDQVANVDLKVDGVSQELAALRDSISYPDEIDGQPAVQPLPPIAEKPVLVPLKRALHPVQPIETTKPSHNRSRTAVVALVAAASVAGLIFVTSNEATKGNKAGKQTIADVQPRFTFDSPLPPLVKALPKSERPTPKITISKPKKPPTTSTETSKTVSEPSLVANAQPEVTVEVAPAPQVDRAQSTPAKTPTRVEQPITPAPKPRTQSKPSRRATTLNNGGGTAYGSKVVAVKPKPTPANPDKVGGVAFDSVTATAASAGGADAR